MFEGLQTTVGGDFKIRAAVNDTLYFSYLGFKSIRVRVTNDWLRFGDIKVKNDRAWHCIRRSGY